MDKYIGKEEGTLKVGQVWHDESNGEPDITILEIGEKLSTKGCNQMGASHDHLHSEVKAITEMDGEKEHWDAENLLDYLICNCYEPVELEEECTEPEEPEEPEDLNAWPYNNKAGYCLCGHGHMYIVPQGQEAPTNCPNCQCASFARDPWGTIQ